MRFDFATSARILFGSGTSSQLKDVAREYGCRALVVTGRDIARVAPLVSALDAAGMEPLVFPIAGEPTIEMVRSGARLAREKRRDVVIGLGGGSPMDAAKAIAAVATNSGEPLDYLEVVGKERSLQTAPLPFIAVATTAGTGAEVTRNAVLGSPEHRVKASLRSPMMLAKVAIVDSDLTLDVPPATSASTGLDTLTQLIEPYVSCRANAFVDMFCVEGMRRIRESLELVFKNGCDRGHRESMSFASLLGGLSLSNAGLGIVHGFAGPLGGMLNARHGDLCAAVLPHGVLVNVRALRERAPASAALAKYAEAARILAGKEHAEAEDLAPWLQELVQRLNIAPLAEHGLTREQIPLLIEKAAQASSTKANPIVLTSEELREVAERAL
jgi:alcohol dehydrogenase class IV